MTLLGNKYFLRLSGLLGLKAIASILLILYLGVGLAPDEAQYWLWSHYLDWGYYSKPPGIAWQISIGTYFFGDSELGVRFCSVIMAGAIAYATYFFASSCRLNERSAFWAALAMAFCPVGILASFAATTDGGFILFWLLTCSVYCAALEADEAPAYCVIALLIACGALFKWPIYVLWLFIILWERRQKNFKPLQCLYGVLLSLIGFVPSLIWNYSNEWATFWHVYHGVFHQAASGASEVSQKVFNGNPFEFIGAQFGVMSPVFFGILIAALLKIGDRDRKLSPSLSFCHFMTGASFIALFTFACFNKLQANWGVFAYPTAMIVMASYALETSKRSKVLIAGLFCSVLLSSLVLFIPVVQRNSLFPDYPIPPKISAFKHSTGWDKLNESLVDLAYDENEHFLLADKYQISSILSFYGSKQKQRAYYLNLNQNRKNQFDFWPSLADERLGSTGYFVFVGNYPQIIEGKSYWIKDYLRLLAPYFREVEYLGERSLSEAYGQALKGILVFKCVGYNGLEAKESERY